MNRIYRLVWSHAHQALVAVSEFASSRGKRASGGTTRTLALLVGTGLVGSMSPTLAWAQDSRLADLLNTASQYLATPSATTTATPVQTVRNPLVPDAGSSATVSGLGLSPVAGAPLAAVVDPVEDTTTQLLASTPLGQGVTSAVASAGDAVAQTGAQLGAALANTAPLGQTVTSTTAVLDTGLQTTATALTSSDLSNTVNAASTTVAQAADTALSGLGTTLNGITGTDTGLGQLGDGTAQAVTQVGGVVASVVQGSGTGGGTGDVGGAVTSAIEELLVTAPPTSPVPSPARSKNSWVLPAAVAIRSAVCSAAWPMPPRAHPWPRSSIRSKTPPRNCSRVRRWDRA